ncbi:sulfate permease [Microbacterium suwonense]|uniref:Sulfate permease n=1 Tax=Microbacterium suwonense TaxID=683047 RepID=A0ABM8FQU8_9MICO|nr:sulfate permease [Microbacterium suwonense]BDZ38011.1 hypothetical protein GCM10025863_06250 [Microbacterium suwonense]
MFRLIWTLSVRTRDYLHRYMPSNRLLAGIRTRRGLKWGIPAMLVALPYILIASICSGSAADGGPGWLHLIVLWACWNALKFIIMGPLSVSVRACARLRSVVTGATTRASRRACVSQPFVSRLNRPRQWMP